MTSCQHLGSRCWLGLVLVVVGTACAEPTELTGPISAWSDGGVSVIPLEALTGWLDIGLDWDEAHRVVSGDREVGDHSYPFSLTVGSALAQVNGNPVQLARPARLAQWELVVPARFAADGLGLTVGWDPALRRVTFSDGEREAFMVVMRPVYPVVWSSILLGGSADGRWVGPNAMAPLLSGGETYQVYGLTSPCGQTTGGAPTLDEPTESQDVTLADLPEDSSALVALGAPWDAQRPAPRSTDTSASTFVKQVRGLLDQAGLRNAKVHLNQVLRVDLDGDGTEEVLISANTPRHDDADPDFAAGDYSLVLLRQIQGNRLVTTVLQSTYHKVWSEAGAAETYELLGTLDLNGDGQLEIVLHRGYYEGSGAMVYELRNGKPVKVLDAAAGV